MVAQAYLAGESAREHWETKEKWDYRTLAHLVNNFCFSQCNTCLTASLKPTAHIAGAYLLSDHSVHSLNVYPGVEGYFVIPFHMGGTTFWMPKFDFAQFLEYNRSLEITTFFSVPPIYLLCAKSPLVKDHFRSLKAAIGTF
jgi:hypothetical protein